MPRQPRYSTDDLLDAALALHAEGGLEATTMAAVARAVGAPSGSVYHRFGGRDELIAALWLRTVERFQEGFVAALADPDVRAAATGAALHVAARARSHPEEAALLLHLGRDGLLETSITEEQRERLIDQDRKISEAMAAFRARLGGAEMVRVRFALIDAPYAAVRPYLKAGRRIPEAIDEVLTDVVGAVLFS